jgi:carbonic anhydrase
MWTGRISFPYGLSTQLGCFKAGYTMKHAFKKILEGYHEFRQKYASGDDSVMRYLSHYGQQPQMMVVACCDSRVDPALILQCDPGDLFVVRNVANIVPPYEKDEHHHGTSAALEFGIRFLKIKHLILLGHSQCGGIQTLLEGLGQKNTERSDFITTWVSILNSEELTSLDVDECAKRALNQSHQNCLTFPWIQEKVVRGELIIHLWFFDVKTGKIFTYQEGKKDYIPLSYTETK